MPACDQNFGRELPLGRGVDSPGADALSLPDRLPGRRRRYPRAGSDAPAASARASGVQHLGFAPVAEKTLRRERRHSWIDEAVAADATNPAIAIRIERIDWRRSTADLASCGVSAAGATVCDGATGVGTAVEP